MPSHIDYSGLPSHIQGGARRYVEQGIPPGSFLTAIITNDLLEACGRADDINRERIFDIVKWFYNEAPTGCWKSAENMRQWCEAGGLNGGSDEEAT